MKRLKRTHSLNNSEANGWVKLIVDCAVRITGITNVDIRAIGEVWNRDEYEIVQWNGRRTRISGLDVYRMSDVILQRGKHTTNKEGTSST